MLEWLSKTAKAAGTSGDITFELGLFVWGMRGRDDGGRGIREGVVEKRWCLLGGGGGVWEFGGALANPTPHPRII